MKADVIKVLHSMVVAVASDFRNHLCCPSLYLFYLSMSRLKCGGQNCMACSRCGRTWYLHNRRISSLILYLKFRAMTTATTLLTALQFFSACFCHSRSFPNPAVDLLSPTVDWTCYIVALHVVVSDVHHRTFFNIEIYLPLACPLNNFIDIIL